MPHETPKLLDDIRDAAQFILDQTQGRSFPEYERDRLLRDAVERNFIVIGEALNRLSRTDPATARGFDTCPQIIGFRNVVVHGYDTVEDAIVWGIIANEIPTLLAQVSHLLKQSQQGD